MSDRYLDGPPGFGGPPGGRHGRDVGGDRDAGREPPPWQSPQDPQGPGYGWGGPFAGGGAATEHAAEPPKGRRAATPRRHRDQQTRSAPPEGSPPPRPGAPGQVFGRRADRSRVETEDPSGKGGVRARARYSPKDPPSSGPPSSRLAEPTRGAGDPRTGPVPEPGRSDPFGRPPQTGPQYRPQGRRRSGPPSGPQPAPSSGPPSGPQTAGRPGPPSGPQGRHSGPQPEVGGTHLGAGDRQGGGPGPSGPRSGPQGTPWGGGPSSGPHQGGAHQGGPQTGQQSGPSSGPQRGPHSEPQSGPQSGPQSRRSLFRSGSRNAEGTPPAPATGPLGGPGGRGRAEGRSPDGRTGPVPVPPPGALPGPAERSGPQPAEARGGTSSGWPPGRIIDDEQKGAPPAGEGRPDEAKTRAGSPLDWMRRTIGPALPTAAPDADGTRTDGTSTEEGDQGAETTGTSATGRPRSRARRVAAESGTAHGLLGRLRLGPVDLEVLGLWLVTRVSLWMISVTAPWLFAAQDGTVPGWLQRWQQWDFIHFDHIATEGYTPGVNGTPVEAFFPGFPLLLRVGGFVGLPTVLVGLVISFVAGGVAAVALARLADREWGEGTGRRAVMAWMLAPPAVFLAAPYTEALFLGFAVPAWLAARKGDWRTAGILAALACTVRVSGVFLLIALAVQFATTRWKARSWQERQEGLWLLLCLVPLVGYMGYLWAKKGDPLAWYHAQADGWSREFTAPWNSFLLTWRSATGQVTFSDTTPAMQANFAWMFRAELVAMAVGLVITLVLLVLRRYGEATWIGLQVVAFATSSWFFSVPRATLLWFPLWTFFGALAVRYRLLWWGYLAVSAPLFGLWAAAFFTGKWAG